MPPVDAERGADMVFLEAAVPANPELFFALAGDPTGELYFAPFTGDPAELYFGAAMETPPSI